MPSLRQKNVPDMKTNYFESDEDEFDVDEPLTEDEWIPDASEAKEEGMNDFPLPEKKGKGKQRIKKKQGDSEGAASSTTTSAIKDSSQSKGQKQQKKEKKVKEKGGKAKKEGEESTVLAQKKRKQKDPTKKPQVKRQRIKNEDAEPGSSSPQAEGDFSSGSFIVSKVDMKQEADPPIWKIEGKSLIQKFTPTKQDGNTLYKNTQTYMGWSPMKKRDYYPAPVSVDLQMKGNITVTFLKEKIKLDED